MTSFCSESLPLGFYTSQAPTGVCAEPTTEEPGSVHQAASLNSGLAGTDPPLSSDHSDGKTMSNQNQTEEVKGTCWLCLGNPLRLIHPAIQPEGFS